VLHGGLDRQAEFERDGGEVVDSLGELLEGGLVLGVDDFAAEDVALVPDAFNLDFELEGGHFE